MDTERTKNFNSFDPGSNNNSFKTEKTELDNTEEN